MRKYDTDTHIYELKLVHVIITIILIEFHVVDVNSAVIGASPVSTECFDDDECSEVWNCTSLHFRVFKFTRTQLCVWSKSGTVSIALLMPDAVASYI